MAIPSIREITITQLVLIIIAALSTLRQPLISVFDISYIHHGCSVHVVRPHRQQDKQQVDGEQGPQHRPLGCQVELAEHGAEVDHVWGEAEAQGADYFSGVSTNTLDLARAVHSTHLKNRKRQIDRQMMGINFLPRFP